MRIGFDVAQTCRERAGCAWYADSVARALAREGAEHTLILYHQFGTWLNPNTTAGTRIDAPNVNMPFYGVDPAAAARTWAEVAQNRMPLPGAPDIVQSNSFQAPMIPGTKLVFVVHDLAFWTHPEFTTQENIDVCAGGVSDALERADGFIFVSQSARDEFESFFPGRLRDRGISSCVSHEGTRMMVDEDPVTPTGAEGRYWLIVGTLEPRKNHENLFRAMEIYWKQSTRRIPLNVAGGLGWMPEKTHQQMKNLEAKGMVRYLGYVSDPELASLYRHAGALVFPSWHEGFGLPVLEAMSVGCPVICTDRGGLGEVSGDATILVNPGDPEAIARAMLFLEQEDGERRRLSEAGRARAAHFTWSRTARRLLDFYDDVLGRKPRRKECGGAGGSKAPSSRRTPNWRK